MPATRSRPPTRRPPGRNRTSNPARLVDRRVGLLFAVFLVLLGRGRPARHLDRHRALGRPRGPRGLATDRGPHDRRAARHHRRPQRHRARRVGGLGHRLRPPVPDRRPRQGRGPHRAARRAHRERAAREALRQGVELRVPAAQDGRVARAADRGPRHRGDRHRRRAQAHLPAGPPGRPGARHGRHGQHRPRRARVLARRAAARQGRQAPARQGRARRADQHGGGRALGAGPEPAADARRRASRSAPRRCSPRSARPTRRRAPRPS